jgi:hypothetical protein
MEEIWYLVLSAVVTFLLVVSEVLGTVKEFESKSISMLTSSLIQSTGEAVIAGLRTPVIGSPETLPRVVKFSRQNNV